MVATNPVREGRIPVTGGTIWFQIVGEGDGTPLVVVAGGPGATHDYLESLAVLADERPVVFYDQLGAGRSDRADDPHLWRINRFVDELEQVVHAVGVDRIHLLGHSYGTIFATGFALRRPTRLHSLILAGPCLSARRYVAGLGPLRAMLPSHMQDALERHIAAGATDVPGYEEALTEFFRRHFCRLDPWPEVMTRSPGNAAASATMWGPSEFVATGIHRDYDITSRLPEIGVPTLFTCGRHDLTRPEETAQDHARVPGSEMVVFAESSHMPHLEEPVHYRKVLSRFLRRVEGR